MENDSVNQDIVKSQRNNSLEIPERTCTSLQDESHASTYYVTLVSTVLEDPRLTEELIVAFMYIANFLKKDGFATCSDQWLATKRRCSIDKVQDNLKRLEEAGYIYRQTWKEGMYWKRRIWLADAYAKYLCVHGIEDERFKKCLRIGKSAYFDWANLPTRNRQKCQHNNKSTKQRKNTTTQLPKSVPAKPLPPPDPGPSPTASALLFSKNKPWIKKVMKECPEELDQFIAYAKAHMPDDSIPERWLMACVRDKYWRTPGTSTEEKEDKNKKICKWITKNYSRSDIIDGPNYIEFVNGVNSPSTVINVDDNRFEEKCLLALRHRKLIGIPQDLPWAELSGKG